MRTLTIILFAALLAALAGCGGSDKAVPFQDKIQKLTDEKAELAKQIEQTRTENDRLQKQNKALAALPDDVKGKNLYELQAVRIHKLTNLYDKDKDGTKEKLIVYIQPIDSEGDIIKATATANVRLLDLNKDQPVKLGDWTVTSDQLKKLWFGTMISTFYRLTFDVADIVEDPAEPLTVKVDFTDHLTGKTFKEQRQIKPPPN